MYGMPMPPSGSGSSGECRDSWATSCARTRTIRCGSSSRASGRTWRRRRAGIARRSTTRSSGRFASASSARAPRSTRCRTAWESDSWALAARLRWPRARGYPRRAPDGEEATVDLGLSGKRAIVTGGSRGIGRAIVLGLAQGGASVAACYNRESDDVKRLRGELAEIEGDGYLAQADVSNPTSAEAFVNEARERFGGVDILINNAGVVSHAMIEELSLDEWRRVLDTNLTAVYLITKAALPGMSEGGSIVNITSAVAMRGMPGRTHYISSKAGLIGFTRALC